jgi:hypothetical protein
VPRHESQELFAELKRRVYKVAVAYAVSAGSYPNQFDDPPHLRAGVVL